MDLSRKSVTLSDGRKIEVFESTWDSSTVRTRIERQAQEDRLRLNGSGDPVFLFFLETFYSYLASCSSGDVPSAEEAFTLPDEDLDRWYSAIVEVNPSSFLEVDRSRTGEVTLGDARFTILSAYLPSVIMRRMRLEEEGLKREEDRDNPKDVFSVYLYPILAACTVNPPPPEVRKTWPERLIYEWKDAVEEINPQWFGSPEQVEARTIQETQVLEKKKEKRPRRSRAS